MRAKKTERTAGMHPPDRWREVSLAAVADVRFSSVDKRTFPNEEPVRLCNYIDVYKNDYITSDLEFMRGSATRAEIVRFGLRAGDVIVTKDSETPDDIGIPAIIDYAAADLVCGYHLGLIRPDETQIDPTFLTKQLGHHRLSRYFSRQAHGLTRYGLLLGVVRKAPIWLPKIEEQVTIGRAARLIDATIAVTEVAIAKLKRVKRGLMHDLLTRGIDEEGNVRAEKTHKFKDSVLGRIPKEWDTTSIGSMAVHVGSGVTPKGGSEVYKQEGVTFIRSQNVRFEGLLLDDVAYIDEETHQSMKRSEVLAHDVLLNITGASIGRCCPVPEKLGRANVNQHVCTIRLPHASREDAVFLSAILASHIGQSQIDRLNAGGNREGLNYEQLRSFMIPWPYSAERTQSAMILEAQNVRIFAEEAYRDKLKRLREGLIDDLFTGRVGVNHLLPK